LIIQQSVFPIVYAAAGAIACVLGWYVWKRRTVPGGAYFSLLMVMLAGWAFADACRSSVSDTGSMLLFLKLLYIGIVTIPPLWILFTLAYTGRRQWLTSAMKALLFVVPAITLAIIATNGNNGLMWSGITPVIGSGGENLVLTYGPWFMVQATYAYILMFGGIVMLLLEFTRSYAKYRRQMAILLLGAFIPIAGNVVSVYNDFYRGGAISVRSIDVSPLVFCVSGILFTWGIFRYRLFDIVPVARETLINNMADGVLVLDSDYRVIDMNPSARKMLGAGEAVIGQRVEAVISKYPSLVEYCHDSTRESKEVVIDGVNGSRWLDVHISSFSDDREKLYGKVVALWDITGRKLAEEEIRQSNEALQNEIFEREMIEDELRKNYEELRGRGQALRESDDRWRRLVEFIPASIAIHREGKIIYVNKEGVKLMGAARQDELVGQPVLKFLRPDYHEVVLARILRMHETGMPVEPIETQLLRLDGRALDVEMTGMPVTYLGNHVILTVIWDIHDRKQAGEKLEASLREKELLLKEIHHRVKNNLQIISSLLSLQTASTMSEEASDMLIESQNRIKSMALIHEKLYMSSDFSCIDFKEYIDSLIGSLFRSYVTARDIRIVRDIGDVSLDIDAAIPCGLIINELITNSLKYAFKDSAGQELRVSLKAEDGVYTLVVGDDGIGLPPGLDFRNTPTLGLQLVVTLTGQLNGNIERLEGKGTTFKITFREKASCDHDRGPASRSSPDFK
jgi:hypothetical protein